MPLRRSAFLLGALTALSACAPKTFYHWGNYEDIVYAGYVSPGKIDSDTQIAKLSENIEQARAQGKPVPPGVHAHLGYLYFLQGNPSAAQQEFETEKSLFPESAVF